MPDRSFPIPDSLANQTVAAALRQLAGPLSWSEAKQLLLSRRVQINGILTLNDARRLNPGETLTLLAKPAAPLPTPADVRVVHLDEHLVVVDKPAGVVTLRHRDENDLSEQRKQLQPTLEELVQRALAPRGLPDKPRRNRPPKPRAASVPLKPLYPVHRLDRDTSGLMMFALTPKARDLLIARFSRHEIDRSYRAVIVGLLTEPRTFDTRLVRDRGDGLRGSLPPDAPDRDDAKRAVTHVRPVETIADQYSLVECRLETGRTHQIRIHLTEAGHMLCGENLYTRPAPSAPEIPDPSGAPRQALHSHRLSFTHPVTNKSYSFDSPFPPDLATWLARLRG